MGKRVPCRRCGWVEAPHDTCPKSEGACALCRGVCSWACFTARNR